MDVDAFRARPGGLGRAPSSTRGHRAEGMHGGIAVVLAIGLLGGCSEAVSDAGECLTAFRNAAPRAGAPYRTSPLDDAIRRCSSYSDWEAAWERVPEAHNPSDDPREYLLERCQVPVLTETSLCEEVAGTSNVPGRPLDVAVVGPMVPFDSS